MRKYHQALSLKNTFLKLCTFRDDIHLLCPQTRDGDFACYHHHSIRMAT